VHVPTCKLVIALSSQHDSIYVNHLERIIIEYRAENQLPK
jgi:hypothetical protein